MAPVACFSRYASNDRVSYSTASPLSNNALALSSLMRCTCSGEVIACWKRALATKTLDYNHSHNRDHYHQNYGGYHPRIGFPMPLSLGSHPAPSHRSVSQSLYCGQLPVILMVLCPLDGLPRPWHVRVMTSASGGKSAPGAASPARAFGRACQDGHARSVVLRVPARP